MDVTLIHNPRCSKSRATLALLQQRGIEPTIREYLDAPLDEAELRDVQRRLDCRPRDMMRTGEAEYAEQALGSPDKTEDELIAAIARTPTLLQRPIVLCGERAAIGRPPEAVLDLFE